MSVKIKYWYSVEYRNRKSGGITTRYGSMEAAYATKVMDWAEKEHANKALLRIEVRLGNPQGQVVYTAAWGAQANKSRNTVPAKPAAPATPSKPDNEVAPKPQQNPFSYGTYFSKPIFGKMKLETINE